MVNEDNNKEDKSLESWLWDAACVIRGEKDASKYKDYILPLVFVKRLCDVFDDEVNRIAAKFGNSKSKAIKLIEKSPKLVRFYLPLRAKDIEKDDTWSAIRTLTDKVGEKLTSIMRDIAKHNERIQGIIDRIDFNATTHGQRDITEESLIKLIEKMSLKRLGLDDVEPDIIGRSYEYLIRKFAEDSGQSAGEFYTPAEVGMIMARILDPEPGMEVYDPCCGSGGLLVKSQIALQEKMGGKKGKYAPLALYGQEYTAPTWAMANMNMVIHDMEGKIEIGDTMKNPRFKSGSKLKPFDLVMTNPMWNQKSFEQNDYENDELERFNAGIPPTSSADWGWMQHIFASLKDDGRAAVVLDTGAVSRGSGNAGNNKEKEIRKWYVDNDFIESVLYLPENLFYNTTAPGVVVFVNKIKSKDRKNKVLLVNASLEFEKGDPKNFIPEANQKKIVDVFLKWKETAKFSKVVTKDEIIKNDYNISPSRYIHTAEAEEYRPIGEIVSELNELDVESKIIDKDLKDILKKLGY
ncbi:MAG: N-6 DNA methylase [Candidatus Firestonebacteria bacterium]